MTMLIDDPNQPPQQAGPQQPRYRPVRPRRLPGQGRTVGPIRPVAPPTTPQPTDPNDLRRGVFTPGADPRLTGAQASTDAAAGAIANAPNYSTMAGAGTERYRSIFGSGNIGPRSVNTQVTGGPAVNPMESARTARYGGMQDDALSSLDTGQTRFDAAKGILQNLEGSIADQRKLGSRQIGQTAASLGRVGSGMVTTDLGNLEERLNLQRENTLRQLAADTVAGDIDDRYRRVSATSGLRGQEAGLDAGRRGEERIERDYGTGLSERNVGRALDDRDYMTGLEERNSDRSFNRDRTAIDYGGRDADRDIADRYDRFGAAGSLEDRIFGQGRGNRDEYRTERGYQQGADQQSLENRIRERALGNEEMDARLRRALSAMEYGGQGLTLEQAMRLYGS